MATADEEIQVLRDKNTELVQKVQHWKMLAAQRENEKLDLMKELNEMRLKLARIRNSGNIQASKLDTALQSASEKALAHLVRASGEIARTIDLAKTYMRERKEAEAVSPRWSAIGGTPKTEKIHRVPPMMIGGQSIQPVVSLSRTLMNTSNPRSTTRSPSQNRNVTERALPMHMLQDVYIPLTRIDAGELQSNNMETETTNNSDDSAEELGLDDSGERSEIEESQQMSDDDYNSSRRLDAVAEDLEPEDADTPPRNNRLDNPLEGPSWLLDAPSSSSKSLSQSGRNLEPDSTTEVVEVSQSPEANRRDQQPESASRPARLTCEFSPTVRRRKRTASRSPPPPPTPRHLEHYLPRPHSRRNSSGRVLKVMVAKMRLEGLSPRAPLSANPSPPASPPPPPSPAPAKRLATELDLFDAPSPNGATVAGVIVSEATQNALDPGGSGEPYHVTQRRDRRPSHDTTRPTHSRRPSHDSRRPSHDSRRPSQDDGRTAHDARMGVETRDTSAASEGGRTKERDSRDRSRRRDATSRCGSHESRDSDSGSGGDGGEGRTRRARSKVISYQEKPLNRKMRR